MLGSEEIVSLMISALSTTAFHRIVGANHAGIHPLELWRNGSKP